MRASGPAARLAAVALAATTLGGCGLGQLFGVGETESLPGERIAVLQGGEELTPDPSLSETPMQLPPAVDRADWPQQGGGAAHAPQHIAGAGPLQPIWSVDIGVGSSAEERLLAQPIVAEGRVFTLDAGGEVAAFDASSGRPLWRAGVLPEDEDEGDLGGGLAFWNNRVFVTTGAAEVLALAPDDGALIWRAPAPAPMRAGPTVSNNQVFVVTVDNRTVALDAASGERQWTHTAVGGAGAGILGGASAAAAGSVVVAPYVSGEVYALRTQNGRVLWSDSLESTRRADALSSIADIRARPVIDGDRVFVVSHSGRMAAIDLRTGGRAWEHAIGGVAMPWVAGDNVFVLSSEQQLICLSRDDGRVRWVTQLPRYRDPENRSGPIDWTGPALMSERLILANSNGDAIAVSPYDGTVIARIELPGPVRIEPAAAGQTIYFLTEDARLVALR